MDTSGRLPRDEAFPLLEAIEGFLRGRHRPLALERLLQGLGEALDLDRVMVVCPLAGEPGSPPGVRAEWHSARVAQHPCLLRGEVAGCLGEGPFSAWTGPLQAGEAVGGPVRERPAAERALLEALGSRWFLALPLEAEGRLRGLLVLDDCRRERELSPPAGQALRLCAAALASGLEDETAWRRRLERDRLATMGRLAARVAHEINNPLAGIRNVLLLLHRELEGDVRKQARLALVDRELERVGRILRRLFELHREGEAAPAPAPLSCRPLIDELFSLLEGAAREHAVRLEHAGAGDLRLELPEALLREVLFNLILNAIEASPEGGVVEVALGRRDGQPVIAVLDRGRGLPEVEPARLLEPFYTTKEETGGLGLGLAICSELMEGMNGELRLGPREGGGTEAALTFSREALIEEAETGAD